ncbi:hypothetical protein NE237_005323 [Protea cynaroides]|uniref:PTM/DIR17-like Tudor domain-containing protein n=1 Tax=Protea cynaroides TaxID=273540 RepID=A0A9Q0QUI7_9MAGN|nr:hypothetical protein NE237_005323 [Protea cynaroides]
MVNKKKRQKSVAGKAQGVETSNKKGTKGDSRDKMKGEIVADKAQEEKLTGGVEVGKGEVEIAEMVKTFAKKRKRGADREMAEAFFLSIEAESPRLRPRKNIVSFHRVLLKENDFDRIVGKRIKVFWPDSRKWFAGQIKSFDNENKLHSILYDDGDKEQLNLMRERFELEIFPSEAFTLLSKSEPYSQVPGDGGESGDAVNEGSPIIDRAETVKTKTKQSMWKQSENDITLVKQETASGDKAGSGDKDIPEEGRELKAQGSHSPADKQFENDISLLQQETALDEGPDAKTLDSQTVSDDQATEVQCQANVESQEIPVKKVKARAKAKM